MSQYSILILAGEASGDYHAAALVNELKELDPTIRFSGIGGDRLAEAGMELLHHYREINTMGLSEGLGLVRKVISAYKTMKRELTSGKHDLFIPVDFPDVNIRLCHFAKAAGVPVCYFVSPQVWAWRKGRIHKIARRVDRMMTLFSFEEGLYREVGLPANFVGHTMAKEIPENLDKAELRKELGIPESTYVVALVPGSRPAEIRRLLPRMCGAAEIFAQYFPETRFVLPLAGNHLGEMVRDIVHAHQVNVSVHSIDATKLMAASDSGLIASGTATLQAALVRLPHALVYVLDPFTWWLMLKILKPTIMDKDLHVGIANVLAIKEEYQGRGPIKEMARHNVSVPCGICGRPIFVPEVLQNHATPEKLANWLISFKVDKPLRESMLEGFKQIREMLTPPENSPPAAKIVHEMLEKRPSHTNVLSKR